jgi:branched-chain amino acid transport system ATP-binding protein
MSYFDVNNITVAFGGVRALNDVSFSVKQNEIFTIIGPNGAGKSTLFNVISRIYQPNNGNVLFDGKDVLNLKAHQISQIGIARTFQNLELFENATVLQNLLLGRHIYKKSNFLSDMFFLNHVKKSEREQRLKVEEIIDFLDLQHYRDTPIHGLPYGVRKNVELARALSTDPKLLLLDEPSSGLTNLLKITVVMIEHDMSFVNKVSDRILALNYGQVLAEGLPEEIQSNSEVKKAYMGE